MNKTMGDFLQVTPKNVTDPASGYASILGIATLQTGVFGGIIIGARQLGVITSSITLTYHLI